MCAEVPSRESHHEGTELDKSLVKWWIIASIIVVILFFGSGVGLNIVFGESAAHGPSEFGDQFGALNTLFSGLAFVALIATVLLQQAELRDTRNEMREQRIASQKSAESLSRSTELHALTGSLNAELELVKYHRDMVRQAEELLRDVAEKRSDSPRWVTFTEARSLGQHRERNQSLEDQMEAARATLAYHSSRASILAESIERKKQRLDSLMPPSAG